MKVNFTIKDKSTGDIYEFKDGKYVDITDDYNLMGDYRITERTIFEDLMNIKEDYFDFVEIDKEEYLMTRYHRNILKGGRLLKIEDTNDDIENDIAAGLEIRLYFNRNNSKWIVDLVEDDIMFP